MKKFALIILIACSLSAIHASTRKVLFLGNSYTAFNNLPQIVADIATSLGDTLIFDSHTPGGYTLEQHFLDNISRTKIIAGGWDYIVMQEQSQMFSFPFIDNYGIASLCTLVQTYNPCARKLLYMTWGRKNGDATNCPFWPPSCTYNGMDSMLTLNYTTVAQELETEVSPVGVLWHYLRDNFPSIELYNPDESHPSLAGSFAAACSFYASIFKNDPSVSTYSNLLDTVTASIIKNAARQVVYDSLSFWDFGVYTTLSAFDYRIGNGQNEIILHNNSLRADSYYWDFGDGTTSTDKNPTHNYLADGTFTISLTTNNCDLNQVAISVHDTTVTFCAHSSVITPDSLVLCPNVSDTLWANTADSYQWYDGDGNSIPGETNQFIPVGSYAVHSVVTSVNGCSEMSPQVEVQQFATGFIFYWVDTVGNFNSPDSVCKTDTVFLILRSNKPDDSTFLYQWFNNGIAISNAVDDTLKITASGNYQVQVINMHCPDYIYYASGALPFTFIDCNIGIEEIDIAQSVIIFPNPTEGVINVFLNEQRSCDYKITDLSGRNIKTGKLLAGNNQLSVEGIAHGFYLMIVPGKKSTIKFSIK